MGINLYIMVFWLKINSARDLIRGINNFMKEIIIVKENIPKIKELFKRENINYEIYQEPAKRFKKPRPVRMNIFADYGEALKDKELETEKRLLEEMDDEEEWVNQ